MLNLMSDENNHTLRRQAFYEEESKNLLSLTKASTVISGVTNYPLIVYHDGRPNTVLYFLDSRGQSMNPEIPNWVYTHLFPRK